MKKNIKKLIFVFTILISVFVFTTGVFAEGYLKIGSKGVQVSKLQTELKKKGFFKHKVTGYFGSVTKASVKKFQKANGLRADGIVGPKTIAKLYKGTSSASASAASRGGSSLNRADDLYWLSRIINAEAAGEPYEGKVAVGSVVLNRIISSAFPNTVYSVIFEYYKEIPQFSPVAEGTIYNEPTAESIKAAKEALSGVRPAGNATYFFNPSKSEGRWIVANKTFVKKIGSHLFYR